MIKFVKCLNLTHMIKVELDGCRPFAGNADYQEYVSRARKALMTLDSGTGAGSDFLGWNELPSETGKELTDAIMAVAESWIEKEIELIVVVGIGGSYLGAKAAIEALSHSFSREMNLTAAPRIAFAGHTLSEEYMAELMDLVYMKNTAVVVISKSGTTTEPAVAFRLLKSHLERQYGLDEAASRIVAVTDASRGALKGLADRMGYRTFVIPDNVGGRYSVLTPVGLLPIALAGFDIEALLDGARQMQRICDTPDENNPAIKYAAMRNLLYDSGRKIEILAGFNPKLAFLAEWWKQLFGESEGKEGRGIFPASVIFTTDLHSMGQYIQQGERSLFETFLNVENSRREEVIEPDEDNLDGLNFIANTNLEYCNRMAQLGTKLAHIDGGVPNITISIDQIDEYNLGQLFYFFEKACGLSAYMLGVNPFDQPGVESYKKNMFALLGKPGYEGLSEELRRRIDE